MRFHVWPAYFRESADVEISSCTEIVVLFSMAFIFGLCAWLFYQDAFGIFLLLFFLSSVFALSLLKKSLYLKKYVIVDICMDACGVRMLDFKDRTIKSAKYAQINAVETRTLDLDGNIRNNRLFAYSRHKLIFIYINDAKCFDDLHLETRKSNHTQIFADHYVPNRHDRSFALCDASKEPKYWGTDVFFHPNCIAFAFNEEAWNQLHA